jgi:predicted TIM-barrel fold metal-dependent hydrolase
VHLASLARRFPDVPIICGHSGGDWEIGVRAIRPYDNVFLEFSGSDPHSGSVDYAVRELGADRIVWGGHGPGRSFSTELSKVLDASLSQADRMKILGGNYRRLAGDIFRKKSISIEP